MKEMVDWLVSTLVGSLKFSHGMAHLKKYIYMYFVKSNYTRLLRQCIGLDI